MFCAASSVSMAFADAGCAALSAAVNEKMLVNAGVVRWSLMRMSHIGLKPSASVSFVSDWPSYMSQSTDHTVDSLHQQPKLLGTWPGAGDVVDGFASMLNVLDRNCGVVPFICTNESRASGSLSAIAANAYPKPSPNATRM